MRVKKKIVWLVVSCLMVLSLVVASCGPAAEEEEEVEIGEAEVEIEEVEEEKPEEEEEVVAPGVEVPKYGGTIYEALAFDITNFANGLEFC